MNDNPTVVIQSDGQQSRVSLSSHLVDSGNPGGAGVAAMRAARTATAHIGLLSSSARHDQPRRHPGPHRHAGHNPPGQRPPSDQRGRGVHPAPPAPG
jgi:hypothetical protein